MYKTQNTCVKVVDFMRIVQWIDRGRLSPNLHEKVVRHIESVGQLINQSINVPIFPQYVSPQNNTPPPLIEHYLYPVSTGTTIRTIKEKFKER